MRRTLQILTFIITAIVIMYGCDSGGSTELNPTITDIQPQNGPPGTEVTISGNDFSPNPAENNVSFGDTPATVNSASETQIVTIVPDGIESGSVEVEVTVDNNTAMGPDFTVMEVLKNQILFTSVRDGSDEIYVMNADGSNPTRLTNSPSALNGAPTVSNDGTKIAFASDRTGNFELFVMNADGSGVQQVTNSRLRGRGLFRSFSWSPDDSRITFSDANDKINIINIDGSGRTTLTNGFSRDAFPDWSPDGTRIAFHSDRDGDSEIYTMNTDGTGLVQITDDSNFYYQPRWSPDGSKFAITSDRNGSDNNIYTINSDGTGVQQITTEGNNLLPTWSADGSELAFVSDRSVHRDIYKVSSDGSGTIVNLTASPGTDQLPHWSPVEE